MPCATPTSRPWPGADAPVKIVQSLARHSTPALTFGVYAHVGLFDQTAALDALPDLTARPHAPEAAELAATGTDGPHKPTVSLPCPRTGRIGPDVTESAIERRRRDIHGTPTPMRFATPGNDTGFGALGAGLVGH